MQIKTNYLCLSRAAANKTTSFKPVVAWLEYSGVSNAHMVFLFYISKKKYININIYLFFFPALVAVGPCPNVVDQDVVIKYIASRLLMTI